MRFFEKLHSKHSLSALYLLEFIIVTIYYSLPLQTRITSVGRD